MATMKTKSIGFNIDCEEERKLFEYAMSKRNFSGYIKELIAEDIQRKKPSVFRTESGGISIRIPD